MEEKKNNNIQDSAEGMGKIIERLHTNVEYAEREGEDMESISWGMQEGMLISYNDAKKILTAILQPKQSWIPIEEGTPKLIEGQEYSENVLAIVEGYDGVMVMCHCYIFGEDGGFVWANCNGNIDGDAEFDDEYNVTHWQPLPSPPNK